MKEKIMALIKPDISEIVENVAKTANGNCVVCQQKIVEEINKIIDRKIIITVIIVDIITNLILRSI